MSGSQERWECPNCGTPLNIASLGIYAKVACPACGHIDHVHTLLANFRIEGVLGLGGMSVVLRARDLVLERPLAIKLLNEFYRDQPERIARFEQECELMAKVRHENVVAVYSAGRVRGQFFIAMELLHGHNLEDLVREQGPMEPLEVLDILRQVVLGLDAACKAGLLHRDMKPANIIIGDDGRAKVLDFGLSLGKREADTEEVIWATPYYVPPETLMRETEDARTDIYALGMTLRHVLTGQENFDPVPEGIEDMLECKRNLEPMAEAMPELPEAYCDLIDHMTAFGPADRPENYAALQVEIAEVRAALVAEERGRSFAERFRRRLPLLGGAVATLALGAGVAAMTAHMATPAPELLYATPPASLPWQESTLLAAALDALQQGDMLEASARFAALADGEGEPAACAWAALHGSVLAQLQGAAEDVTHFAERLQHHLERSPVSAGAEMHSQIATLKHPQAAPGHPFLRAAHNLMLLNNAARECQEREMKQQLHVVRSALRSAGAPYAPMLELLQEYDNRLKADFPQRAAAHYHQSLTRLNITEAARTIALMESAAPGEEHKARLSVQREALALVAHAVEMMKRHSLTPSQGVAVAPEQLPQMLSPLENPTLAAEITALMHVAHGNFDTAASVNPHAQTPDSPEPFAVIMRDWLRRVK